MAAKDKSKATSDGVAALMQKATAEWNKQIVLPQQVKLSKKEERLRWQRLDPMAKMTAVEQMGREQWEVLMKELYGEA